MKPDAFTTRYCAIAVSLKGENVLVVARKPEEARGDDQDKDRPEFPYRAHLGLAHRAVDDDAGELAGGEVLRVLRLIGGECPDCKAVPEFLLLPAHAADGAIELRRGHASNSLGLDDEREEHGRSPSSSRRWRGRYLRAGYDVSRGPASLSGAWRRVWLPHRGST
jgi:hypothetical protein